MHLIEGYHNSRNKVVS